jgi:hypothetical protein
LKRRVAKRFSSVDDSSMSTSLRQASRHTSSSADDASHLSWQATRALFVASAVPMVCFLTTLY